MMPMPAYSRSLTSFRIAQAICSVVTLRTSGRPWLDDFVRITRETGFKTLPGI